MRFEAIGALDGLLAIVRAGGAQVLGGSARQKNITSHTHDVVPTFDHTKNVPIRIEGRNGGPSDSPHSSNLLSVSL